MFIKNVLCFSLCPLPLVMSVGITEKSLALFSSFPPIMYLYTLIRSPLLSLLFSRLQKAAISLLFCPCPPSQSFQTITLVNILELNIQDLRMLRV